MVTRRKEKPVPMLSPREVAEALNEDYYTILLWLQSGKLKGYKIGKHWRVYAHDVQMFVEQGSNQPGGNASAAVAYQTQAS